MHRTPLFALVAAAALAAVFLAQAGDLNPPAGPVAPTPGPNPATVVNQTNTPGDANNVFIIDEPGSYRFDRNLTLTFDDVRAGVHITAANVTLDMGGFTITGTGEPTNANHGVIIDVPMSQVGSVVIRNGSVSETAAGVAVVNIPDDPASNVIIEDFNATNNFVGGVMIFDDSSTTRILNADLSNNGSNGVGGLGTLNAINVTANGNGDAGIFGGPNSNIINSRADGNGQSGIGVISGRIQNSDAHNNGADGVLVASTSGSATISDSRLTGNTGTGVNGNANTTVSNTTAQNNGGTGILAGNVNDSISISNSDGVEIFANGSASNVQAKNNQGIGVNVGAGGRVANSIVTGNLVGAKIEDDVTLTSNTITDNLSTGVEAAGGVTITSNTISSNGDGVTMLGGTDGDGGGVIDGNRFEANTSRGIVILSGSDKNLIIRNVFRGNGSPILDFALFTKLALLQCNPLTAGPYDNWEL